ncbi:MAG: hypothetical protein HY744_14585 [Deltaproteobacteria bacterium]|nr:hypothetical protein [Deltaproteobacteria bacterium]
MSDPAIGKAHSLLERLSADPVSRQLAEMREKAAVCYQLDLTAARQEGRAEGEAEGEARGRAEGEARGRAEGEARGRAEGEARGRVEGEARGEVAGKVSALLVLLAARGIALGVDAEARIRGSRAPAELDVWIRRAATVSSIGELFG